MIRTEGTYTKLTKVFTGTYSECNEVLDLFNVFQKEDIKVCTRGNNWIAYFRPDGGKTVNEKVWMMHWNKDNTVSLYL